MLWSHPAPCETQTKESQLIISASSPVASSSASTRHIPNVPQPPHYCLTALCSPGTAKGRRDLSPSFCLFALINEETNRVPAVFLKAVWSWRRVKPLHSLGSDDGVVEDGPGSIICYTGFTPQHQHTFKSRSKGKLED